MSSITKQQIICQPFDDIKVSTKTFTSTTNLLMNIEKLYNHLPVTHYVVIPKKRGRKKVCVTVDPNVDIPEGSIIAIRYENNLRGIDLKKKPNKQVTKKWFRNSITIVILLDKLINFKVCRNGTFQMTGCKHIGHAEQCIKYIWAYIKDDTSIYSFTSGDSLETLIIPSMRNIDFSLGFKIDREKLNTYMLTQPRLHCLLETSFGYTGVNIKFPLPYDIREMKIKKMSFQDGEWIGSVTTYDTYINKLPEKDKINKLKTKRYNTFLVFHSGKVIMSGSTSDFMRDTYITFLNIIKDGFDDIEERLIK